MYWHTPKFQHNQRVDTSVVKEPIQLAFSAYWMCMWSWLQYYYDSVQLSVKNRNLIQLHRKNTLNFQAKKNQNSVLYMWMELDTVILAKRKKVWMRCIISPTATPTSDIRLRHRFFATFSVNWNLIVCVYVQTEHVSVSWIQYTQIDFKNRIFNEISRVRCRRWKT